MSSLPHLNQEMINKIHSTYGVNKEYTQGPNFYDITQFPPFP